MTHKTPALAASLLLLGTAAAHAHAFLKSSEPAVGATVPTAPATLSITYTEGVEPAFSAVSIAGAGGTDMAAAPAHPAAGDRTTLILPLKPLPPGTYRVRWHVTAVDTHRTEGDFSFTVAPRVSPKAAP